MKQKLVLKFWFSFFYSALLQVLNDSPDETASFRMVLNRKNSTNSLVMIQPSLLRNSCYSPSEPMLLQDVAAISGDWILLSDAYFSVAVLNGAMPFWHAGYKNQPKHEVGWSHHSRDKHGGLVHWFTDGVKWWWRISCGDFVLICAGKYLHNCCTHLKMMHWQLSRIILQPHDKLSCGSQVDWQLGLFFKRTLNLMRNRFKCRILTKTKISVRKKCIPKGRRWLFGDRLLRDSCHQ